MLKVLVTGSSGFIGNKISEFFCMQGYEILGWDCFCGDNVSVKTETVDMLDYSQVIESLRRSEPDIVIHCAGLADVNKSVRDPNGDYNGNVTITHNLLFAIHELNMTNVRMVFLSSAGVYGNPTELPVREDTVLKPLSPYALHKVMCEDICRYFINNYGMDIKIARIFSAYGAGLRKQIFWDMYSKLKNTGELELFGTGSESRDYIYIDDVAQALFLIATKPSNHIVFNVANGKEITIQKAAETFAECYGFDKSKIVFNGIVREGDPLNWRADISRIASLGYCMSVSTDDGIKRYVNWAVLQEDNT